MDDNYYYSFKCSRLPLIKALQSNDCMNAVAKIISDDSRTINEAGVDGFTPLCYAVMDNVDIKVVEYLLLNGADVNKKDKFGSTPLHYVKTSCVVKLLLKYGADVTAKNCYYCTPLLTALTKNRNREVILELINGNSDINVSDFVGEVPLHLAFQGGYDAEVVSKLFSKTKDVNIVDRFGFTPLSYAASHSDKYSKEFISELVNKGAFIGNADFKAALIKNCNPDFIAPLTKCGIDIKCLDSDSNNGLHLVNSPKLVYLFIKNGASVHAKNCYGLTPLMNVLKNRKQLSVIQTLLDYGSCMDDCLGWYLKKSANSSDSFNDLQYDDEIVNELILRGADINLKNESFLNDLKLFLNKGSYCIFNHFLKCSRRSILGHVLVSNEYASVNELFPKNVFTDSRISTLYQVLNKELDKMKEINILNGISFYDFCMRYYKSRKHRINASECEYVLNNYYKINRLFPNLKVAIITKIKINLKNQDRVKLLKRLFGITMASANDHNPCVESIELYSDCLYNVGYYLDECDINSLICAAITEDS